MDLEPTEQQRAVVNMVREFAEREIAPGSSERDITEEFPAEILRKMGDLGLMGIMIPEE